MNIDIKLVEQFASLRNMERKLKRVKKQLEDTLSYCNVQVKNDGYLSDIYVNVDIKIYEETRSLYYKAKDNWSHIHHMRRKIAEDIVISAERAANEALAALKTQEKTHIIWEMEGQPVAKTRYREVMDGKLKMVKEHSIELTPKEAINLYLRPPKNIPGQYYIGLDDQGYYYYVEVTSGKELSLIYEGDAVKQKIINIANELI
jgi:hypothetical protein